MSVSCCIPAEDIARNVAAATEFLSRRSGVIRVWLFGSAAKGKNLDWRADLDFAVEGLPAEELERTWSELYSRLDLPVDLVRWEAASGVLKEEVRRWGRLLYET
ncbi:MAG: nucleotidyltransferase family protein [Limisphaerales bacterium]